MADSNHFNSVFLFSFFLSFASTSSFSYHKCSKEQSDALLLFKQSLSSNFSSYDASYFTECKDFLGSDYYPIMMNWSINTDCCNWDGITCDHFTGDVIGIDLSCGKLQGTIHPNSTLFHLPHLETLNLAFNDFTGSQIPHEIGRFSNSLTHFNITRCGFGGQIPSEILFLSRLISLDLSLNSNELNIQPSVFKSLLQNSTHLRELLFARVNISSVLPTYLNISPSLRTLDLKDTNLQGKLPDNIFNHPYMQKLALSWNFQLNGALPNVNRSTDTPLKFLDVSNTRLSGQIPDSIGNLKFLNSLDLSRTGLSGKIPNSIGNLKYLNHLRISLCYLSGSLPKSLVNLTHLFTIDLSSNFLNGTLPSLLFTLPSLENVMLDDNLFSGGLPSVLSNYSSLEKLSMGHNQFDGEINQNFIQLNNLNYVDLRYNNFSGLWELDTLLSSLPQLKHLYLSYSGLSVVASNGTSYANTYFNELALASCNLTMFPASLRGMKILKYLDLSRNYIQGRIPNWAGEIGGNELYHLDLSYNFITGLPQFQWDGLKYLSLKCNLIEGQFPPSICNMNHLWFLDMSNNRFGGVIPQCFGNIFSELLVVNMGNNSFHGTIPNANKECFLYGYILNGNQLEGDVPSFLSKCQYLEILDFGNNHLNGTFPSWLENLSNLKVLVLKVNSLHGLIETSSKVEKPFTSLQVLDLSQNGFVGHLPQKYFDNFISMKEVVTEGQKPQYLKLGGVYYSLVIGVKNKQQLFSQVNIHYTIVDLSNNKFEGEIPIVICSLNSLIVLNLSHNHLNGIIPYVFGNLSAIESLDLSWNQLIGEIPQSLADMVNLEVLNLSQNHLVGRIPTGKQFDTFDETSFGGNSGLCGHPLTQLCEHVISPQLEDDGDEEEREFPWKEVLLGYGCGTVVGLVMGFLMWSTRKPKWFNAIVNAVEHMILKRENRRRYIYIGK